MVSLNSYRFCTCYLILTRVSSGRSYPSVFQLGMHFLDQDFLQVSFLFSEQAFLKPDWALLRILNTVVIIADIHNYYN